MARARYVRAGEVARWSELDRPPPDELAAFCEACGDPVPAELLAKPKPKRKRR